MTVRQQRSAFAPVWGAQKDIHVSTSQGNVARGALLPLAPTHNAQNVTFHTIGHTA